ncbi:MAG: hypothetical protein HZC28_10410 [Spirochaetes bacterium]|nr:hypothetical protein [Spirochaetota bacterium]
MDNIKKFGIPIVIVLVIGIGLLIFLLVNDMRKSKNKLSMADDVVTNALTPDGDVAIPPPSTNAEKYLYLSPDATNTAGTSTVEIVTPASNAVVTVTPDITSKKAAVEPEEPVAASVLPKHDAASASVQKKSAGPKPAIKRTVKPHVRPASAVEPAAVPAVSDTKPVITDFIINYNKHFSVTKETPLLITISAAVPSAVKYINVRIYARRVSGKKILTRDLVYDMKKMYCLHNRAQTQFLWNACDVKQRALKKGSYILFAEVDALDDSGERTASTGRYVPPKWERIITLK